MVDSNEIILSGIAELIGVLEFFPRKRTLLT